MPHPPSTCTIEVDLTRVLWLTRGWRWDYVFLLKPLVGVGDAWANIQWRVFAGTLPAAAPHTVAGRIDDLRSQRAFLATTFLDPQRRDVRGRAVTHHLVWFPPDERRARMVAPADWGPQLVAALAPAFDAVFALDLPHQDDGVDLDPDSEVQRVFARELARVPPLLRLTGPAVMVYVLRPFEAARVELPASPPGPRRTLAHALLLWAATFAALLLLALVLRRGS